jgi:hypothetical protein
VWSWKDLCLLNSCICHFDSFTWKELRGSAGWSRKLRRVSIILINLNYNSSKSSSSRPHKPLKRKQQNSRAVVDLRHESRQLTFHPSGLTNGPEHASFPSKGGLSVIERLPESLYVSESFRAPSSSEGI